MPNGRKKSGAPVFGSSCCEREWKLQTTSAAPLSAGASFVSGGGNSVVKSVTGTVPDGSICTATFSTSAGAASPVTVTLTSLFCAAETSPASIARSLWLGITKPVTSALLSPPAAVLIPWADAPPAATAAAAAAAASPAGAAAAALSPWLDRAGDPPAALLGEPVECRVLRPLLALFTLARLGWLAPLARFTM